MKILIADDNESKSEEIETILKDILTDKELDITFTTTIVNTTMSLIHNEYDLLILDMQMPRYEEDMDDIDIEAGIEILDSIQFYKEIKTKNIIVCSSNENVGKLLEMNDFQTLFVVVDEMYDWSDDMKLKLEKLNLI